MEYSRYRNGKRIYSVGRIEENGAKYYGIFEKHDDKATDETTDETPAYPQDQEKDECRYLIPNWLLAMSEGLTRGAVKHPGETWRQIPAKEHAWRAIRHLLKYIAGDTEDDHLTNASMRVMMAWETDRVQHENNITCSDNSTAGE